MSASAHLDPMMGLPEIEGEEPVEHVIPDRQPGVNSAQFGVVGEAEADDDETAPKRIAIHPDPSNPGWSDGLVGGQQMIQVGDTTGYVQELASGGYTVVTGDVGTPQPSGSGRSRGSGRKRARKEAHKTFMDVSQLPNLLQLGEKIDPNCREGFTYHLDAPVSGLVREGEDNLTYLNKDQFYALTLQYVPSPKHNLRTDTVISIITVQFREKKERPEALSHWEFWHVRQHSSKIRLIDVDAKLASGLVGDMHEMAHNAVWIRWSPLVSFASVPITIRCLSTDFSSQKGVKGIPLHIQIDTYECENCELKALQDRSFCQIKTFCDKGAERKAREEERRLVRQHGTGISHIIHQQSIFQRSYDLTTRPVFYTPRADLGGGDNVVLPSGERIDVTGDLVQDLMAKNGGVEQVQDENGDHGIVHSSRPKPILQPNSKRNFPPRSERVMLYVRQENEDIYSALHVVPPSITGLVSAISGKYQIEVADIRFLFRKTTKGILVKMDDDMIKFYCNGEILIMKVLATEDPDTGSVFYDVVFSESTNRFAEDDREEDNADRAENNNGEKRKYDHESGEASASNAKGQDGVTEDGEDDRAGLSALVAEQESREAAKDQGQAGSGKESVPVPYSIQS